MISIIIPFLNEVHEIPSLLEHLERLEGNPEIIFVDGGSTDGGDKKIQNTCNKIMLLQTGGGRACQMNAGARVASGDILLFLHADCRLPVNAVSIIENALRDSTAVGGGFCKRYTNENWLLMFYRMTTNVIRTRWLKNFVGTNAVFVRKFVFEKLGGYAEVPLLEDVFLSDKLKKTGRVIALEPHVLSSSRRYYEFGIARTIYSAFKILFLFRVAHKDLSELKTIYTGSIGTK